MPRLRMPSRTTRPPITVCGSDCKCFTIAISIHPQRRRHTSDKNGLTLPLRNRLSIRLRMVSDGRFVSQLATQFCGRLRIFVVKSDAQKSTQPQLDWSLVSPTSRIISLKAVILEFSRAASADDTGNRNAAPDWRFDLERRATSLRLPPVAPLRRRKSILPPPGVFFHCAEL